MEGRHQRDVVVFMPFAAQATDGSIGAQQGLGCEFAEGHDQARGDGLDLCDQVRLTGLYLFREGIPILWWTALDDVADVDLAAIQPHGQENPVEELAGFSDKRLTETILVAARSLTDKDDFCGGVTDPENDPAAMGAQRAALTLLEFMAQLIESPSRCVPGSLRSRALIGGSRYTVVKDPAGTQCIEILEQTPGGRKFMDDFLIQTLWHIGLYCEKVR